MPTYDYQCHHCGHRTSAFMTIHEYINTPPTFMHCAHPMERRLSVVPIAGLVFNDRHYQDLRASDGTDISSRAKHQAYMKAKGLTTMDDYKETWKKNAQERQDVQQGIDPSRKADIAQAIEKLGG